MYNELQLLVLPLLLLLLMLQIYTEIEEASLSLMTNFYLSLLMVEIIFVELQYQLIAIVEMVVVNSI